MDADSDANADVKANSGGSAIGLPGLHLDELKKVLIKFNTNTSAKYKFIVCDLYLKTTWKI